MLVQLPSLASLTSIKSKGKQLEKGHVEYLSKAYLPIAAAHKLQGHEITEIKGDVFEVIGKLVEVECQDCNCPADVNEVLEVVKCLGEAEPKGKDEKVKNKVGAEGISEDQAS